MPHNNSRQLGALRDLPAQGFDVLAAVLFQADCRILRAALIPHARVVDLAKRVERTATRPLRQKSSRIRRLQRV
jgi:hypothetical protein